MKQHEKMVNKPVKPFVLVYANWCNINDCAKKIFDLKVSETTWKNGQ